MTEPMSQARLNRIANLRAILRPLSDDMETKEKLRRLKVCMEMIEAERDFDSPTLRSVHAEFCDLIDFFILKPEEMD